jgi:hypothetical protein
MITATRAASAPSRQWTLRRLVVAWLQLEQRASSRGATA